MDFDPNPPTGERNRSGPRWYSVIAFLVVAFLLLLIAVAINDNTEATREQACQTSLQTAVSRTNFAVVDPSLIGGLLDFHAELCEVDE